MNLSSYFPLLVDLMLKSVVLFGVAWVAARFARQVSAANRHLIWLAAFGQVLVLPFLTAWVSGNHTGQKPATGADKAIVLTLPAETFRPSEAVSAMPVTGAVWPLHAAREWGRDHWRDGVVGMWLGVAVVLLGRRLIGAVRLRRLNGRSGEAKDARIKAWALRIAVEHGLRRPVKLRTSPECPVAMTWGTWRPVVMLPADAPAWSNERLELVLRHELAHVARWDCLARLLSQVACALYWPNPLVWLGARRLRLAQEQACDDRVLAAGAEARAYAAELLAGAKALSGRRWSGAPVAMAEPSTLETRIRGIVDEGRDRGVAHRLTMAFAAAAATLALVGCAALRVRESAPTAVAGRTVRQVEIESRFVEFRADTAEAKAFLAELETAGYVSASGEPKRLSKDAAGVLVESLSKRVATDLLSTPKVTVLSGSRASISVAQEVRSPADAAPGAATGTQSSGEGVTISPGTAEDFAKRNVGVEMKVLPRLDGDDTIELELTASVTELEGFVASAPEPTGAQLPPAGGSRLAAALSSGMEFKPIFSTLEKTLTERIKSGQSLVFQLGRRKRVGTPQADGARPDAASKAEDGADHIVLVLVSATEIPIAGKAAGEGSVAAKSAP